MGRSRTYRTVALVLAKTKLKETDLILTLLAEDGRQIRAVAKGARKPGARAAARCELGCVDDLLLARGRNLDVISQVELKETPLGQAPSFELLSAAAAVLELACLCSFEDAKDAFVFSITCRALEVLGMALDLAHLDLIVAAYAFKLLSHLGYRPDLVSCVACGEDALSYFSAAAGGMLCASCAKGVSSTTALSETELGWLRSLMALRFNELAATPIDCSRASRMLACAHTWGATHLDHRLRALEFLRGC